jgi:hypothetical protein
VFGIRLLRLDANIAIAPAEIVGSPPRRPRHPGRDRFATATRSPTRCA